MTAADSTQNTLNLAHAHAQRARFAPPVTQIVSAQTFYGMPAAGWVLIADGLPTRMRTLYDAQQYEAAIHRSHKHD